MGSDITPDNLRGFLIPADINHFNIWLSQSSYTQQNGRAGIAEAQQNGTGMQLMTTGDQEFGVTIKTQNGGTAGVNANYLWKFNNSIYEYGQNWTGTYTGWDMYQYDSSELFKHTDAVQMQNGILYTVSESQPTTTERKIKIYQKIRSGAVTFKTDLLNETLAATPNCDAHPTICKLQDGSLYVAHANYASDFKTNMTAYRSYDDGTTWQTITTRALLDDIDLATYTIEDIRAVISDNVISLFIELVQTSGTTRNHVAQYRSVDSGLTFELVGQVSTNADGRFHSCRPVQLKNGFVGLAYIDTATSIKFRKIPTPGIRLSSTGWSSQEKTVSVGFPSVAFANLSGSELVDGDLTCFYNDSRVFVFARKYNDGAIYGYYSADEGDTWTTITSAGVLASGNAQIFNFGSWPDRLKHTVAVPHEGHVLLLGHKNNRIHALSFGGYSLLGYPKLSQYPAENQYMKFFVTWVPVADPVASSYFTQTGAGISSLLSTGLELQTNATQQKFYTYGGLLPTDFDQGIVIRWRLEVNNNTNLTNIATGLRLIIDNGTLSVALSVRIATNRFILLDHSGQKVSVNLNITQQTEFELRFTGNRVLIAFRPYDQNNEKEWIASDHPVNFYASTGSGSSLVWGHVDAASNFTKSKWQEFAVQPIVTVSGYIPQAREVTPRAAFYPSFGEYKYITMGMSITTKQTPARGGDDYKIDPRYDFAIDNIFYPNAMSPRIMWRSADDDDQQEIAFFVDRRVGSSEKSYHDTDVIGIHLNNINFSSFDIYRRNGASWQTVMQVNNATLSGSFERSGHTIQPSTTGTPFYLQHNEAAGWRCKLQNGGNVRIVKIVSNTEGVWGQNTDQKRAALIFDTQLSDVAGMPTTGTCYLMPDKLTLVIDALDDVNNGDVAFKIRIRQQDTLEGYYQIGNMIYGHVAFPAPQYQRGRSISFESNIQEEITLDNMFYARKLSDGGRRVSLAWTEPIDSTKIYTKDPDYWQFSNQTGAHPVANYGDAAHVMLGIARQLSNELPIVYLPKIRKNDRLQLIKHRADHIYCRLDGPVTIDSVLGDEGINEAWRVGTINLVEIE